ncbi:MAG: AAA family ATPase, partial [Bacteroidales bacterium]|nr:AAA family ATPase [Bacteroidales bacterium]
MLYRKIGKYIKEHLLSNSDKILIIEGARQIGKSFIIRETGKSVFKNFIEINLAEDDNGEQFFKNIRTTESFYLALSSRAGASLNHYEDTLVFIDEIQQYPQFLTLLKFLREEKRYHFIASGSLLGLTLRSTTSIPIGSIIRKPMFQLDFEEFLLANGFGRSALLALNNQFNAHEPLTEELHRHLLGLFRRYLLIGGMPDAVNTYLETHNIVKVREIHNSILSLYGDDAAKYEQ